MKKFFVIAAMFASVAAVAQELTEAQKAALDAANAINNTKVAEKAKKPNYWTKSVDFDLGLNQAWMSNWTAGGYPTISLAAGIDGKATYEHERALWANRLQLNYGLMWSADKVNLIQSSNDRIYLESKYDYKMSSKSKFAYSAALDFRTQFAPSLDNFVQDSETKKWSGDLKSSFFAPAYINVSLGVDWKPKDWFNMSLSPLTGGVTVVGRKDDGLRKSYGMPLVAGTEDQYKSAKWMLGAQLKANVDLKVNDWFHYETQVVLFGNYFGKVTEKTVSGTGDEVFVGKTNDIMRLNWDNKISFNVAKYFKVALQTWLIYDPSVYFVKKGKDLKTIEDVRFAPVQFKEYFSINFTYTLGGKK